MSILDRYIAGNLLWSYLLVALVLLPLFTLLDLIQQLNDVGKGSYELLDALRFELFMLPRRTLDLAPFVALIGSAVALGSLAHHSELIALQACGVTVLRAAGAVLKTGVLLTLGAMACDEIAVSPLHRYAEQQRSIAVSGSTAIQQADGFWIHSGRWFLNINEVIHGGVPANIDIYEFDEQRRLQRFIHAARADISDPERWVLEDLVVKQPSGEQGTLNTERLSRMQWQALLGEAELSLLAAAPHTLSAGQLYQYVKYLNASRQDAERFELALWRKLALPLATIAMVLLAIPFAFGSMRSKTAGKRIVLATSAGVAFQIANELSINAGLILKLPAPVATLLPVVLTFLLALWLLVRVRV